jgi:threonine dehydrogenase-like Zn-dependent dehydrogenase
LLGGAVEVAPPAGGFKKGDRYVVRVETVCRKVEFTDEVDDKTGQVTGCAKGHGLRITGASLEAA